MDSNAAPQLNDGLNGWKEIAAHLGRSARSVQRWERDLGLPIHRIATPDGGSIVYALRSEVDAWRRRHDESVREDAESNCVRARILGKFTVRMVSPERGTTADTHAVKRWLNAPCRHGPLFFWRA